MVFSKGASDSGAALEENAEKVRDLDQAFAALEQTVSGANRDFVEHARSKQADIADIENRMSEMSLVLSRANEVASLELDKFNAALSGFTKIVNQDSAEYGTLMSRFHKSPKSLPAWHLPWLFLKNQLQILAMRYGPRLKSLERLPR